MKGLFAAVLVAATLHAQHREEVTVEVVEVPVYVTTSTGPLEGLTRDRFELFVNGKPHPIDYFDVVDLADAAAPHQTAPDIAPVRDVRRRRLFLLMFDLVFSRPAALARGRAAAAKLVAEAPEGDAFAVATHTNTKGLQFVVPFTSDRPAVGRALQTLRASSADDPMRLRITDSERQAVSGFMTGGNLDGGGDRAAGLIEDPFLGGGEAMDDNRKQPLRRMIEHQVEDLGVVAKRLAQLEGQKHIVVFSEGFNPYVLTDMGKDRAPGPPRATARQFEKIQEMYRIFQGSDTFLHAVDIAGLRHGFDPLVNDALNMLSSGTGGEFIRNRNDLAAALDDLQESHGYSYVLGFQPRNARRGHNRIEVKVRNLPRGSSVSYRRGFAGTAPADQPIDGLRLADILSNDIPQHGIATTLESGEGGVIVTVPASAWVGLKPGERPEVLLYVFDRSNVAIDSRRILLNPGAGQLQVPLRVEPGQVVKVLVRAGQSLGFARLEVR